VRSTVAEAWNRPTAPLKPGSSGIGFTSTVIALVARSSTCPESKNVCGATPTLSFDAGSVMRPERVGYSSLVNTGKRGS
jgi:hypothetical protein